MGAHLYRLMCGAALVSLVPAQGVLAHPHSFISLKTEIVSEAGQITALKMRWKMDEITSADLLYDAGDAAPGSPVWKKLAAEVMTNVIGQHYFTEFWHNGQKVKFAATPLAYGLAREGHQAVLTFTLPLAHPQPVSGERYTFATFDPTYYVSMSYDAPGDVTLGEALRERCNVAVKTPQPDAAVQDFALSLDKSDAPPEDMDLGKQFAQQVTLQCQ
ncbi:DUF1007 family protein [Cronobacter turicensis]|uniref:DUF1007 family protein n=1 Tax=unclassified Cronobacter TaxID=2649764 RepID=UPI0013EB3369|nr:MULTISPECIES: DUF1007 family protein [unclassified Cronobacter]ELQ6224714.1 DUF1007 family protein [Cronobacter turicensis]KAF6592716.1 DUF1007 family protein [Cronobacter sp. EKM101R]KAF6595111.1 DUF1007 family protein [Cronobacter sp. EKM102R]